MRRSGLFHWSVFLCFFGFGSAYAETSPHAWDLISSIPEPGLSRVIDDLSVQELGFRGAEEGFGFDRETGLSEAKKQILRARIWKKSLEQTATKYTLEYHPYGTLVREAYRFSLVPLLTLGLVPGIQLALARRNAGPQLANMNQADQLRLYRDRHRIKTSQTQDALVSAMAIGDAPEKIIAAATGLEIIPRPADVGCRPHWRRLISAAAKRLGLLPE